jgi:hypothetical protein
MHQPKLARKYTRSSENGMQKVSTATARTAFFFQTAIAADRNVKEKRM